MKYITHVLHLVKPFSFQWLMSLNQETLHNPHPPPPPPQPLNQLLVSVSLMGEQGVDRNFPFIETHYYSKCGCNANANFTLPLNGDDIFLTRALWKCSCLCWDNPDCGGVSLCARVNFTPSWPSGGYKYTNSCNPWLGSWAGSWYWLNASHMSSSHYIDKSDTYNDVTAALWVPMNCELLCT